MSGGKLEQIFRPRRVKEGCGLFWGWPQSLDLRGFAFSFRNRSLGFIIPDHLKENSKPKSRTSWASQATGKDFHEQRWRLCHAVSGEVRDGALSSAALHSRPRAAHTKVTGPHLCLCTWRLILSSWNCPAYNNLMDLENSTLCKLDQIQRANAVWVKRTKFRGKGAEDRLPGPGQGRGAAYCFTYCFIRLMERLGCIAVTAAQHGEHAQCHHTLHFRFCSMF